MPARDVDRALEAVSTDAADYQRRVNLLCAAGPTVLEVLRQLVDQYVGSKFFAVRWIYNLVAGAVFGAIQDWLDSRCEGH